ncbi:MAG: WD40 repeat domain-containing protein, partial [Cyanobacteria bacterium P01_E01_bin.45]
MTLASATSTSIQPNRLTYDPSGQPVSFTATVVNVSGRFATFRLEVIAAGAATAGQQWYRLTPAIGAKVPPGDRAEFTVEIIHPPVRHFAGDIDLTVRIVALELGLEERQLVRLSLAGSATLPLQLDVTTPSIQARPGAEVDLGVRVTNPNPQALAIGVQCRGLSPDWLPDGTIQRIKIAKGQFVDVSFLCQIPAATARSQIYPVSFTLIDAPGDVTATGTLDVQPIGEIELDCEWPCQRLQPPAQPDREEMAEAVFELDVSNSSNLPQIVSLSACYNSRSHRRRPPIVPPVTITPTHLELDDGETEMVTLVASHRRPWLGWTRRYQLDISGSLSDDRVPLQPEKLPLEMRVAPMIPLLVQLAGAIALIALAAILPGLLKPTHHTAPVRTVRFNGAATELVSGSDDRSIRRWQIRGNRLVSLGVVAEVDEAVRVVRYRPVRNNWLAAGYENGSMQLLNLVSGRNLEMFAPQIDGGDRRDDRVFALAVEPDSRLL